MLRGSPGNTARSVYRPGLGKRWGTLKFDRPLVSQWAIVVQPVPLELFCSWSSTGSKRWLGVTEPLNSTGAPVTMVGVLGESVTIAATFSWTIGLRTPSGPFTYQLRLVSTI